MPDLRGKGLSELTVSEALSIMVSCIISRSNLRLNIMVMVEASGGEEAIQLMVDREQREVQIGGEEGRQTSSSDRSTSPN